MFLKNLVLTGSSLVGKSLEDLTLAWTCAVLVCCISTCNQEWTR